MTTQPHKRYQYDDTFDIIPSAAKENIPSLPVPNPPVLLSRSLVSFPPVPFPSLPFPFPQLIGTTRITKKNKTKMAQYFLDLVYSLTTCMSCFPSSPNLTINQRSFKILRLLGEGGFSYVYLVQDNAGDLYALKKIRCTKFPPDFTFYGRGRGRWWGEEVQLEEIRGLTYGGIKQVHSVKNRCSEQ